MKRLFAFFIAAAVFVGGFSLGTFKLGAIAADAESDKATKAPAEKAAAQGNASLSQQTLNASRAAREEKAIQDARRQQLAEKEAAMAAKEVELKKMSDKLDAQIKLLEESKKQMNESLKAQTSAQKKAADEKSAKMVKLFKTLRGEQAGKLIDGMEEDLAMGLLSRMDTKSAAKLVPYIKQPRILKWVSENLRDK